MAERGGHVRGYLTHLFDSGAASTALRVALVVGTLLFVINHGAALIQGDMDRDRWVSACLTYLVPYAVNIHGQYVSRLRINARVQGSGAGEDAPPCGATGR